MVFDILNIAMPTEIHVEKPKKKWKKIALGLFSGAILAFLIWFGFNVLLAGKNIITQNLGNVAPWFLPKLNTSELKGEGDGRINILLLGLGGANHPGGNLTDTMMLASIDPMNKKIALLSIPRDLQVKIDGGYAKINYAHAYGESHQKETGGGGALAKKIVDEALDMPIHYFLKMDFEGFPKLIDAIGGVDVLVDKAISDPYYPAPDMKGYAPFYLKAGQTHMNGALALKYARSRETTSDFDRSDRQQKLLKAFFDKSLSVGVLANPAKLTSIISILGTHVKTDLSISEMNRLVGLGKEIDKNNIATKVLDSGTDGLLVSKNGEGGYVLVPKSGDFKDIQKFVHSYLTDPFLAEETAKIEIQNASAKSSLGDEVADLLKNYGYTITSVTDATKSASKSVIYDYSNGEKSATLTLLKKRLGIYNVKKENGEQGGNIDLLVVLGKDFKDTN